MARLVVISSRIDNNAPATWIEADHLPARHLKSSLTPSIAVEIVKRKPDQVGFAVQPRRWVVERFFAWISRNRRLWKDTEATMVRRRGLKSGNGTQSLA